MVPRPVRRGLHLRSVDEGQRVFERVWVYLGFVVVRLAVRGGGGKHHGDSAEKE